MDANISKANTNNLLEESLTHAPRQSLTSLHHLTAQETPREVAKDRRTIHRQPLPRATCILPKKMPSTEPLTTAEKSKLFLIVIAIPTLFYIPLLLAGAYVRTYPKLPGLWFGFKLTIATLTVSYIVSAALMMDCPHIVRLRMHKKAPDKNDSMTERIFFTAGRILIPLSITFAAWDAKRYEEMTGHEFDHSLHYFGSSLLFFCFIWIIYVLRTNQYASAVVFEQKDHVLITSGPYRVVRHPMYFGVFFFVLGYPLCVGSFWGILPLATLPVLLAFRISNEEAILVKTFPGAYPAYKEKVRYRMIPFIF